MNKQIACTLACGIVAASVHSAVTSTATWDYSVNTGNTSPAAAATWTDAVNWNVNPEYPSGAQWKAVLTGATGMRYISIPGPLTLGAFTATKYDASSAAGVVVRPERPSAENSVPCKFKLRHYAPEASRPPGEGLKEACGRSSRHAGGNREVER